MENMKITLISDNMAMGTEIRTILQKDVDITVLPAAKVKEDRKLLKGRDAVIFTVSGLRPFRETLPFLRSLSEGGMPVFCITAFPICPGQMDLDRISFLEFPIDGSLRRKQLFAKELVVKVKSVYGQVRKAEAQAEHPPSRFLVGIGASTGGPGALISVLGSLPEDTCGILVVQHMSPGFMDDFTGSLDSHCRMQVWKGAHGEVIRDGNIYLAPEGCQMEAVRCRNSYILRVTPGKCGYEFSPSVDCLFGSIAECAGERAMGIILTGMGDDGARGLLKMKEAGACTVGQDKETSSIYSMPEKAFQMGGVLKQRPLGEIAREIARFDERMKAENKI